MGHEYLVAFGRAGHVGRFQSATAVSRGDQVVVRGRRGLEIGRVLGEHNSSRATLGDEFIGTIERVATGNDAEDDQKHELHVKQLCCDANALAAELGLGVLVLDGEISLDGRSAVLHGLRNQPPLPPLREGGGRDDESVLPLLERLGEAHQLIIRWFDLGTEPNSPTAATDHLEEFKCDKPDCGEGHCDDCGDGCSSCSAGGAKELEAYFAGLRQQMESQHRMPLY